ncbi:MAG: HlyD family type I secretion periplasmic adaptor subunit, partial [Pseudomonadota bacterium]
MHKTRWTVRGPLILGLLAVAALLGLIAGWGTQTKIAGAIVANGMVEVETNRQVVQHPDGGVVGAILASDGDQVTAGDVVLRLDDTFLQSEIAIVQGELFELMSRRARLQAERDGVDFPPLPTAPPPTLTEMFTGQAQLFEARRISLQAQRAQYGEQLTQIVAQIDGLTARSGALQAQLDLIRQERADNENLLEKGLTKASALLALQRQEAALMGDMGQAQADIARLKGQIAGLELRILELDTTRREQAIETLRDVQLRTAELRERLVVLNERLARLDVRAPVSGTVFRATVFAKQSVIQPAQPVMYIVPQDQPLIVSARVDSIHIDQIHMGQGAQLRFTALDQRTTPDVRGHITHISADVLQDDITG